jgi:hypothetical protein
MLDFIQVIKFIDKKQLIIMRKIPLLVIAILIFAFFAIIYRFAPKGITGFFPVNVSVGVGEKTKGEITALIYKENINFTDFQNIIVEFSNVGSTTITSKIEIRVYWNNQSKLQEMAYYYDSSAVLYPSMRRYYTVSFLPPYLGVYYIKAKVPYDSRAVEEWGSFLVTYPPSAIPVQIVTPPEVPGPTYIEEEAGTPSIALAYPEKVKIRQGESKLFNITVRNNGNINLNKLRLYISTTNLIDVEINPKQVFKLVPNESVIFLISINASKTAPVGSYSFDFEAATNEIREKKGIELEIVSEIPSLKEDIYETILNYEYIISEVQHEIDFSALKGIDVKIPQDTLNKAIEGLTIAKQYYQQEKYDDAKNKLAEVKKFLEDAVYQLAVANIGLKLPAVFPTFMILIFIIIGVAFAILFILWKRKREKEKEKRPKLLRGITETET